MKNKQKEWHHATKHKKKISVKGIDSASICSLAGRYDNPNPTRFLAPVDCSKILALTQYIRQAGQHNNNSVPTRFLAPIDYSKNSSTRTTLKRT
jgi:hypothetical protein